MVGRSAALVLVLQIAHHFLGSGGGWSVGRSAALAVPWANSSFMSFLNCCDINCHDINEPIRDCCTSLNCLCPKLCQFLSYPQNNILEYLGCDFIASLTVAGSTDADNRLSHSLIEIEWE
jgi:hypothetical protein